MNKLIEISFIFINVILICTGAYLNFIEPASCCSNHQSTEFSIKLIWLIILCVSLYSLIQSAVDYLKGHNERNEKKDDDH